MFAMEFDGIAGNSELNGYGFRIVATEDEGDDLPFARGELVLDEALQEFVQFVGVGSSFLEGFIRERIDDDLSRAGSNYLYWPPAYSLFLTRAPPKYAWLTSP